MDPVRWQSLGMDYTSQDALQLLECRVCSGWGRGAQLLVKKQARQGRGSESGEAGKPASFILPGPPPSCPGNTAARIQAAPAAGKGQPDIWFSLTAGLGCSLLMGEGRGGGQLAPMPRRRERSNKATDGDS